VRQPKCPVCAKSTRVQGRACSQVRSETLVLFGTRNAREATMPRAIWSGSLGFGLVQIPVSLHAAEETDELSLTLLDKRDFSPVGYERINKKTGKEVKWEDTVKGYDSGDGKYVVLTERDFAEANPKSTHQIDILDFVELAEIDPHYIDKPYVVVPSKFGKKPYALLREVLKRSGKAGIAKLVLRTRQHLCAIIPHGKALSLLVLRFADELRSPDDLELPEENLKKLGITSKELDMAEKLVSGMVDKWQPERYRDDYRKDLLSLIHARAKAGEVNSISKERAKAPRPTKSAKVVDLVALLAKSVESGHHHASSGHRAEKRSPAPRAKVTPRKHAPSKHAPSKRGSVHPTSHRKSA